MSYETDFYLKANAYIIIYLNYIYLNKSNTCITIKLSYMIYNNTGSYWEYVLWFLKALTLTGLGLGVTIDHHIKWSMSYIPPPSISRQDTVGNCLPPQNDGDQTQENCEARGWVKQSTQFRTNWFYNFLFKVIYGI